jgi:hypothetical protein
MSANGTIIPRTVILRPVGRRRTFTALDGAGRILFAYDWHGEQFADRYGQADMAELEDWLRNTFESIAVVDSRNAANQGEPTAGDLIDHVDVLEGGSATGWPVDRGCETMGDHAYHGEPSTLSFLLRPPVPSRPRLPRHDGGRGLGRSAHRKGLHLHDDQ